MEGTYFRKTGGNTRWPYTYAASRRNVCNRPALNDAVAPAFPPHTECGHKLVTGSIPPTSVAPANSVKMFFGY